MSLSVRIASEFHQDVTRHLLGICFRARRTDGQNGDGRRGVRGSGLTPIGTYCYHADMSGDYGDTWVWSRDQLGCLETKRWYCLEQQVRLNTPGKNDGILRAWIDGRLAFEKTDIRFRDTDKLKIERLWMNFCHGGGEPSPHEQHAYIDNLVIAREYIGPIGR